MALLNSKRAPADATRASLSLLVHRTSAEGLLGHLAKRATR
jgi:hypothetical protein